MKANELRIGNYLIDGKERLCKVELLRSKPLFDHYDEDACIEAPAIKGAITTLPHKPIELTEEWLIKFGFDTEVFSGLSNGKMTIYSEVDDLSWWFGANALNNMNKESELIGYEIEIKYVHQLQNLYFALTGEELEINDNSTI